MLQLQRCVAILLQTLGQSASDVAADTAIRSPFILFGRFARKQKLTLTLYPNIVLLPYN
jgi:hypothetical protein